MSSTVRRGHGADAGSHRARVRPAVARVVPVPLVLALLAGGTIAADEPVDFNFQVRPLLSDRCFSCHGPDERARKRDLRLDTPEGARKELRGGGVAIEAGSLDGSEIWSRITEERPSRRMPPPDSNLSLAPEEIDVIRRWILQGAEYRAHWSLIPVGETPVPAPAGTAWTGNPIDAFVVDRLMREGLRLSPAAPKETLIRRLSLDLRGLPPSLEEIDEFLADESPDAWGRQVDRMLASPHYGEKRAMEWLDLARYADTHGYQADVERDVSPWRDWVLRAFNENLPFDRFLTWQLAGDLLPSPTRDQVLATAFQRLHRQTNEGGSIEEEFRTEYVADRVNTFGTSVLGLTIECARCHDHKYDPISQKDYYRLFAFFDNIDESGLYSHFTQATPTPTLLLWPEGAEQRHRELAARLAAAERELAAAEESASGRRDAWVAAHGGEVPAPRPVAAYSFDEVTGGTTPNSADPSRPAALVDGPVHVAGRVGKALRFSGDDALVCRGAGAFDRTSPMTFALWVRPEETQERAVVLHRSRSWTDSGSRGYELLLEHGRPSFALIHFWPGNALRVRAREVLRPGEWRHVAVAYDGSSRAAGVRILLDGRPVPTDAVRDGLTKGILHRSEWGDHDVGSIELTLAGRFRDSGFKGGCVDELLVFDRALAPSEVRRAAGLVTGAEEPGADLDGYVSAVDDPSREARERVRRLREEEGRLVDDVPEIMVLREMSPRRKTHVLRRGAYDAPGEEVEPCTPEMILRFPDDLPRDRLGLARWVTDPSNPLTARVIANRAWRAHFGRGIVATPEDFGSQGRLPTHPELLDFLARTLVRSGWDLKGLHRLIATSETYRQSSRADAALLARDPENALLARGPRHRLLAEEIRDSALAVSGLLSPTIGGKSVKPYQPAGLWEEAGTGKTYVQDSGEKLWRRSLYTFWRRTAPPPSMLLFDATSREVCSARRETTRTPLQALVLLNDPQFVEAARALAERLLREHPLDLDARIVEGFRLATGRRPDGVEVEILRRLHSEQLAIWRRDPVRAAAYLEVGERPVDPGLAASPDAAADLAATATLANGILNLEEFVTKR